MPNDQNLHAQTADEASEADRFDALILGAGVSGLVAASLMLEQGCRRVAVVDEYPQVGGNHLDRSIGDYTFDIGCFLFQDDSPLLRHFPEILAEYVPVKPTVARLNPQGVVTDYPISLKADLFDAGAAEWLRMLSSLLAARSLRRRMRNARDYAQYWIGAHLLQRTGLAHYMERFYGLPPEQIDLKFAEKRMGWVQEQAQLRTHLRRLAQPSRAVSTNTQLVRPREGFAKLYQPAVAQLERRGVSFQLGAQIGRLRREGAGFALSADGRRLAADRVVSTIPLERIGQICGLAPDEALRTVTLISLFFSFAGDRGFPTSILYNFSANGALRALGVESIGRQGGFDYQPTARDSTLKAEAALAPEA